MSRTWFSYVVLAIGLMMLMASDKRATAEDKQTAHQVNFGGKQQFEIIVDKEGDENSHVKILVDGKAYNFNMPDLADGEDKVITTDDGTKIMIKSASGDNIIWIDGEEMQMPSFGNHNIDVEGLSAMIGRSHQLHISNDITISADGLSDDVRAAIVDAIDGVLISYDVKKKVSFRDNNFGMHMIRGDGDSENVQNYKFQFDTETSGEPHVNVIHKKIHVEEKIEN